MRFIVAGVRMLKVIRYKVWTRLHGYRFNDREKSNEVIWVK